MFPIVMLFVFVAALGIYAIILNRDSARMINGQAQTIKDLELLKPLTELLLASDLMPAAISGDKVLTIRQGHRNIHLGPLYIYDANDRKHMTKVVVGEVVHTTAHDVPLNTLSADGFPTRDAFIEGMKTYYPNFNLKTEVTIIFWTPPNE